MAKKTAAKIEKEKPLRLVILDTHAIIHRAYHALPELSSSKGEPTGALFGLVSMLLKLIHDLKPDFVVAARDLPGATVRHEMFEGYKATRMKADDALIAQLKRAPIVYEAFGIPLYEYPAFEADDVVGSIVKQVEVRSDINTIIATGDMDTLQLVRSPHHGGASVSVYTMRKGISDTVLYDEAGVEARYGFGPERIVDYKALRGDPSDNIPGIRGIGEKTATELIKAFGSLDKIYKTLEENPEAFTKAGIKARIVELLKSGKADAAFSKQLATIHTNVPIKFEMPKRMWHLAEHVPTIASLCDELEFRTLKNRVRSVAGVEEVAEAAGVAPERGALRETSIALWLLRSDLTNPTLDDILRSTHTEDFGRAREILFKELRETGRLFEVFETIEKPLIPVVDAMNAHGVYLDVHHLESLRKEYSKKLAELAGHIYTAAGHEFNVNSPKQLAAVLYDELKIGVGVRQKKTATGARTTREEELSKLSGEHPIIADVLSYRELQKLLGTYIEKMPSLVGENGRLHAEFVQAGTTTGRMSSQNPNLQNIPIKTESGQRIREAFAAPDGKVIAALDYSQIELRIAAGLSGDEKLIDVFQKGGDVHTAVAAEVFDVPLEHVDKEMRRCAKVINFGILYGMGANALRENLGATVTRDEASRYLDEYFKQYAGLARFVE
ncbi:MAG TPA: DNA polymerase, partial [Candidatus Paceibacterota bacterium]